MTFRPSRARGISYGLLATLLFGLNASTSHVMVAAGIDPIILVIIRTTATALICGGILLATNRQAFTIAPREWPKFLGLGIVGQALMIWCYTQTVSRIPVGIALLFEYTTILMIPLVTWLFFKQRPGRSLWLGIALVMAGLVLVAKIWTATLPPLGMVFGFLTAGAVTVYFVIGDRIQLSRDSFSTLFHAMWIASAFWLLVRRPSIGEWPNPLASVNLHGNLAGINAPMWLMLLWVAIIGSFLPFFLAFSALRHLNATAMGVISTSETLFAFLFGWVWLGETIDGIQTLGGGLVIAGILVAQLAKKSKAN